MVAHEAASARFVPGRRPGRARRAGVVRGDVLPRFHYNWSELVAVETGAGSSCARRGPSSTTSRRIPENSTTSRPSTREVAATLARHLDSMNLRARAASRRPRSSIPTRSHACRRSATSAGPIGPGRAGRGRGRIRKTACRCCRSCCRRRPTAMRDGSTRRQAARGAGAKRSREPGRLRHAVVGLLPPQGPRGGHRAAKRAVALDPESAVAVLNLAFAFHAAGRRDEAAAGFERVLALDPEQPQGAAQPRRDSPRARRA